MWSIIGGIVAVALGVWGLIAFEGWTAFLKVLHGAVPILLVLGGVVAVIAGASSVKEAREAKKAEMAEKAEKKEEAPAPANTEAKPE
jgi:glucose uptake protein GlcU